MVLSFKKIAHVLVGATAVSLDYVFASEVEQYDANLNADADEEDLDAEESSVPGDNMPNIPGMPEGFNMEELMKNLPEGMDMEELMKQIGSMGGEGGDHMEGAAPAAPPKPTLTTHESAEELEKQLSSRAPTAAIYVFKGKSEAVKAAAEKLIEVDSLFAEVSLLLSEAGVDEPESLTVYKGKEEASVFDGADFDDSAKVSAWALANRVPAFGQIDGTNYEIYFEAAKNGLFWACFEPSKHEEQVAEYTNAFVAAAEKMKGAEAAGEQGMKTYPFVWLNVSEFAEHAKHELGCTSFPTIVLQKGDLMSEAEDAVVEKYLRSFHGKEGELTTEAITTFFNDIESGALKPEPIPDPLDAMDDEDEEEEEVLPAPATAEEL